VPAISKSKYLAGLQCSKLLWYHYNAKEKIPAPDAATQAIFDQGHQVGELAKSLFPGGVEVAKGVADFGQVLPESLKAVGLRRPLFEPAFKHGNAFARADILNPVGRDQWEIVEVKSSTEVKGVNLHDLALQWYTYEGAGLKIRRSYLMYINNQYVRRGKIDPGQLFVREDVTTQVTGLLPEVENNLKRMMDVIRLRRHPDIRIGSHCSDPYGCPLQDLCWAYLPDHSVVTMYRLGRKAFDLLNGGVQKLVDIPADFGLTAHQRIQQQAVGSGRPVFDRAGIAAFLESLEYPLYYLDFETFNSAIPLFDEVRPYQQIPFQFSLHIVASKGDRPEHHSYLADGAVDPRPEILARLRRLLGRNGSIVSYNASFERGRLSEACEVYPEYRTWWEKTEPRVVDLLEPFRSFYYYHPDQQGSASMKVVLPVLTGKGYVGLAIADGEAASREFLRVTLTDVDLFERERVRQQLEEYCALDTLGMVEIVRALEKLKTS
jgi:hypothetical protein